MKIAIIGCGISGMTTYLHLKKHLTTPPAGFASHSITIYDTYPSPRRPHGQEQQHADLTNSDRASLVGAGLGIGANGMAELRALDPDIHREVLVTGYPGTDITMRSARGAVLGRVPAVKGKGGTEYAVWIARQAVWDILRRRVADEAVKDGKKVELIEKTVDGRPVVRFVDGECMEFDLVIGADGVWSKAKKFVVGDGVDDDYPPRYEELMGVGGFMPSSYLDDLQKDGHGSSIDTPWVMTFGAEGFFGYGACSVPSDFEPPRGGPTEGYVAPVGRTAMWWSTFEANQAQDWSDVKEEQVREQLRERHKDWADPVIRRLASDMSIDLRTATFTMPVLPCWSRDSVVLIGDAAHALPTTSGQGISQAFEDAHAFAALLSHYLNRVYAQTGDPTNADYMTEVNAVAQASKRYESMRKPRTSHILKEANRMGARKKKMNLFQEYLTYTFLYIFLNLAPNKWTDTLLDYSIEEEVNKVVATDHHDS